jgi:hypothetical protein
METTLTLECTGVAHKDLEELEHQLKHIHGLKVFLVMPKDEKAPVLLSIGMNRRDEQADLTVRRIGHVLYDFLHRSASVPAREKITLVTIEGESIDIAPLASDEIKHIIATAYAGQR